MAVRVFTAEGPAYQQVKDKLFDQDLHPIDDDATGLSQEELISGFNALARQEDAMSRMALRSRLFAYVLENARIRIDPDDWFADHFDDGDQLMIRHREAWPPQMMKQPGTSMPPSSACTAAS